MNDTEIKQEINIYVHYLKSQWWRVKELKTVIKIYRKEEMRSVGRSKWMFSWSVKQESIYKIPDMEINSRIRVKSVLLESRIPRGQGTVAFHYMSFCHFNFFHQYIYITNILNLRRLQKIQLLNTMYKTLNSPVLLLSVVIWKKG